jgi:hypothetical protein
MTLRATGSFEICPVCFWVDDGRAEADAAAIIPRGPNGGVSLSTARANYAAFGACALAHRRSVRPPHDNE